MSKPSIQIPCLVCDTNRWRTLFTKDDFGFLKCPECGLVRLDPIPGDDEIRRHYEARAIGGNYDITIQADRSDQVTEKMFSYFRSLVDINSGSKRLLDIGCYTGEFLNYAADDGFETWGVEFQEGAAEIARRRHGDRIFVGPLEEFVLSKPAYFDFVSALGVIEHLQDSSILIRMAKTALRHGGLILIQTPNTASIPARLLGRYWPCYAPVEHIHYFSRRNLTRMFESEGFRIVGFSSHWKRLEFDYVYHQLQFFGREIHSLASKIRPLIPNRVMKWKAPFYGGEMFLAAMKS